MSGVFTDIKASLIGMNGKFTKEFSESIVNKKNNNILDHECYSGTGYENLCEYAGRMCYKSGYFGKKNRPSPEYHKHIIDSKHHSVYGHSMLTFKIPNLSDYVDFCVSFAGVPGWYPSNDSNGQYVTVNFRFMENLNKDSAVLRFNQYDIFKSLYGFFNKKAPNIFKKKNTDTTVWKNYAFELVEDVSNLDPVHTWYSFELVTSRRVAQELTRHGFQSAISMESSRYVPILNNGLVVHPLVNELLFNKEFIELKNKCDDLYRLIESNIYDNLKDSGEDASYARKQARGAATGAQMMSQSCTIIYSCSKTEFESQICSQRINHSADMEINNLVKLMKDQLYIN